MGPGVAFIDYDNEGWPDIFVVNGMDWPGHEQKQSTPKLYHNNHDGTFTDVTRKAGLDVGNLKSKAGKNTGANNVRDYDPARRKKTDGSTGFAQTRAVWLGGSLHIGIDNGTCAPDWLLA